MARRSGGTGITLNDSEMQSYLDGEHGVRELLQDKADAVLAAAQADPHDDTYEFEESLDIQESHTDRLVVRVFSDDPGALAIEARYGILARALDAG